MSNLHFVGDALHHPQVIERDGLQEQIPPYLATPDLVQAVNLAILLKRPLLLMGEPGCGKSRLAQAVAYELYHGKERNGEEQDYRDWYFRWNIKSQSKARDGLYEYDAIRRLGDAQILSSLSNSGSDDPNSLLAKDKYIYDRPLGQAIKKSSDEDWRAVILIDEIDKADIDFPNDLLNELDQSEYTITETGETIRSQARPIIFITSNAEKDLPDAFLRRCLYHYIDPLPEVVLKNIIHSRFYAGSSPDVDLVDKALKLFLSIRKELKQKKIEVGKNVSTGELLDWFEALKYYREIQAQEAVPEHLAAMVDELEKLGTNLHDIPFRQILFKNWNTLINFKARDHAD